VKSPSFFTPSSACFTTSVATRLTRATGDCFRVDFFRELLRAPPDLRALFERLADLREVFERLADLLRPRFFDAVAPRRIFFAADLRELAPRFRPAPRDFLAPDDRFFEALRPDFLLDDLLRVAIGQLLIEEGVHRPTQDSRTMRVCIGHHRITRASHDRAAAS
jgi:hypothetical protein